MHSKYRRRRLRAEHDFVHRRQTTSPVNPDDVVTPDTGNGDSNIFSTPITLTVIETIAVTTSASSTQMTTLTSLSTISSISTFTPIPSVLPPSATPSTTSSPGHKGNNADAQDDLSTSSASLSGGAIAGIVIACLIFVAVVLIFFLRKRFIQRRRKRATGTWTRRSGTFNPASLGFRTSNEPKIEPFQSFRQGENENHPIPNVTPPPMAMNSPTTPYTNSPTSSFTRYPSTAGGAPSTTQSPLNMSPFLATVVCTFVITLPDELSITIGEKMRVLAEYDDGWALCMKTNGEQGMVPLECLDQSRTSTNNTLGLPVDSRGSRRFSSLDGVGLKVARS
ncbi:hypothetical protein BJ912DRAFT_953627 [Pholiota molesta]|nr:hypothetical protein BJ912DRAFT_953627 [Pholiota molesta]